MGLQDFGRFVQLVGRTVDVREIKVQVFDRLPQYEKTNKEISQMD